MPESVEVDSGMVTKQRSSNQVVRQIWTDASLKPSDLSNLDLTGEESLLPSSFHAALAAQSTVACAALASTVVGVVRGGRRRRVSVDRADAERECTGYFAVDGRTPDTWAPLSGIYPCADGFVRIHANFDHHRDGVLRLLDLQGRTDQISKAKLEAALLSWRAVDFETAAADAGLVVSAARSFEQWDRLAAARAVERQPLVRIEKIGQAAPIEWPTLPKDARSLSGVRVLDLTRILAGPVCGRTLADYGADVLLVNSPRLPNIDAIAETSRGKLSAYIDLDEESGFERLHSLSRDAHLFVQSYRPGALAERGFSPSQLAEIRPGIVYVSLSAYGGEGPWAGRRGFDSLVQTATGFNLAEANAVGESIPKALPFQILDYASGYLMAFGGQVALLRQQEEGGSWHVQVSLAATARWLRGLGRVNFGEAVPSLGLRKSSTTRASGFGRLTAIPHAARFDGFELDSLRPSMPPGTHAPSWPNEEVWPPSSRD
ncbi:MAG: CoA transferase [Myxococcota bacterium]|nr:CoA transferase [Myxococcota bacterium]